MKTLLPLFKSLFGTYCERKRKKVLTKNPKSTTLYILRKKDIGRKRIKEPLFLTWEKGASKEKKL